MTDVRHFPVLQIQLSRFGKGRKDKTPFCDGLLWCWTCIENCWSKSGWCRLGLKTANSRRRWLGKTDHQITRCSVDKSWELCTPNCLYCVRDTAHAAHTAGCDKSVCRFISLAWLLSMHFMIIVTSPAQLSHASNTDLNRLISNYDIALLYFHVSF